jgi:hypothetical protein
MLGCKDVPNEFMALSSSEGNLTCGYDGVNVVKVARSRRPASSVRSGYPLARVRPNSSSMLARAAGACGTR